MSLIITIDPSFLVYLYWVYKEVNKFIASTARLEYVEDKVVFKASLPATNMEDVNVEIKEKVIILTKELKIFEWLFQKKLFEMKRFCRISRSYELPEGVKQQVGDLKSKMVEEEDGILTVTVTFNKANTSDLSSRNGLQTVLNKVIAFLNAQMRWEVSQDKHVFKAYLPAGMKEEDVSIEIDDDSKEIRIIKQLDMEEGVTIPDWLLEEFSDGKISRSFKLPKFANPNGFKTDEMADGVLTVTFTQINNKPNKELVSKLLRLLAKAAPFNKLKHPKRKLISNLLGVLTKAAPVCFLACPATLNSGRAALERKIYLYRDRVLQ